MKLGSLRSKLWQRRPSDSVVNDLFLHEPAKARGNLIVHDDFLLDASLNGSITSQSHVTIGPNAVVEGSVSARSIHHQGSLQGSLSTEARLVIQSGSKLQQAKVQCDSLEIQPGSQLIDVIFTTS